MGHSYVEFGSRSLLVRDIRIVMVVHVALHVARRDAGSVRLTDGVDSVLAHWGTLLGPHRPGFMDVGFDTYVTTAADRDCVIRLLGRTRREVQAFGDTVPGEFMSTVVDAPALFEFGDCPGAPLVETIDKILALLSDGAAGA